MKNILLDKGISLYKLGKYNESLEFFENSLKYDDDSIEILQWIGMTLESLGNYDEAKTYFEKCTEIESNNGVCWRQQGYCWFNLKNYEKSLVCFENDLKINPNLEHSLFFKGLCLFNLKRYIVALTEFEKIPKTSSEYQFKRKMMQRCNQMIKEKDEERKLFEDLESISYEKLVYGYRNEERERVLDRYHQNEFNEENDKDSEEF